MGFHSKLCADGMGPTYEDVPKGNAVASYVWGDGIDNLLAVKVGDETYYPLTDIQGTVWGYADSSNSIVARWIYDAWGNVLDESVSIPVLAAIRYRFQGREWSAATGLVNFRMRWYDSDTGRWLSKDPIGLGGGLNLYAFCENSPIQNIDPDEEIWEIIIPVVGVGLMIYGLYEFYQRINDRMNQADVDDLSDIMDKSIDCMEDTLTEVTPLFGPPSPDLTLPAQNKVKEKFVRPIWRRIFDNLRRH